MDELEGPCRRKWARRATMVAVRGYQLVISPILGPHCRFQPTCSEYARQAIESYGVLRGVYMGVQRICRCHPWHPGGYDPISELGAPDGRRE